MNIFGIPVSMAIDESTVVIGDNIINMYGCGDKLDEAVADYKKSIHEYYADLKANEDELGDNLQKHLSNLRGKLED
jgi:hypothetical protein